MAAERPLVSTDVGVMPDLVSPALLTKPKDIEGLARTIGMVARQPGLLEEVLVNQKRTMSQLTLDEFLKRTLNLYQSLLDGD
jgi:glycosyltransferase involved in cell wall biosynthesis